MPRYEQVKSYLEMVFPHISNALLPSFTKGFTSKKWLDKNVRTSSSESGPVWTEVTFDRRRQTTSSENPEIYPVWTDDFLAIRPRENVGYATLFAHDLTVQDAEVPLSSINDIWTFDLIFRDAVLEELLLPADRNHSFSRSRRADNNKIGRCDEPMQWRSRWVYVRRGSVSARSGWGGCQQRVLSMTIENHARPEAPEPGSGWTELPPTCWSDVDVPSACEAEFRRRITKGNMSSGKGQFVAGCMMNRLEVSDDGKTVWRHDISGVGVESRWEGVLWKYLAKDEQMQTSSVGLVRRLVLPGSCKEKRVSRRWPRKARHRERAGLDESSLRTTEIPTIFNVPSCPMVCK